MHQKILRKTTTKIEREVKDLVGGNNSAVGEQREGGEDLDCCSVDMIGQTWTSAGTDKRKKEPAGRFDPFEMRFEFCFLLFCSSGLLRPVFCCFFALVVLSMASTAPPHTDSFRKAVEVGVLKNACVCVHVFVELRAN